MSRHFVSCMNIQEQAQISWQEVVPERHCHFPVKFHHLQGLEMDAELSTDRTRALRPSGNRLPQDQWLARLLRHPAVQPSSHSCRRRQCSSTTSQNALLPFPCSSTSPAAVAMPTDTMYSFDSEICCPALWGQTSLYGREQVQRPETKASAAQAHVCSWRHGPGTWLAMQQCVLTSLYWPLFWNNLQVCSQPVVHLKG